MTLLGAMAARWSEAGDLNRASTFSAARIRPTPGLARAQRAGAVLDQLGRHAEAQKILFVGAQIARTSRRAFHIGMSYVLTKDLKRAEVTLRRALAQPNADRRCGRTWLCVVGLRGRSTMRKNRARRPLRREPRQFGYLRQMLAQQKDWKKTARPFVPQPNPGG